MANSRRSLSAVLAQLSHWILYTAIASLLLAAVAIAQQTPATANLVSAPGPQETVTIPAGTRLALVLTHPVDSKSTHRGDQIYAETTAPVTVNDGVVLPAGTFVQGEVEKLRRDGTRGEFAMQSLSVVLANGYVANISGPTNIHSEEGTAWRYPSGKAQAGAITALLAGPGLGLAIGSAMDGKKDIGFPGQPMLVPTHKGLMVGAAVGSAAGVATSMVMLFHTRQFYVETGSPMNLTLARPVVLPKAQIAEAVRKTPSQAPVPMIVIGRPLPPYSGTTPFPVDHGTCYTPEVPGTPPTVIPGIPATPDSPGTPDVVIPGTPATPGTPYPCP